MLAVAAAAVAFRIVSALVTAFVAPLSASRTVASVETSFGIAPVIAYAADRWFGRSLAGHVMPSTVVAWLAFAAAMVLLLRLAELDIDGDRAGGAVLLAAVFPFASVFGRSSADAMFFAFAIAAFDGFRRERWILGGVCGAVATAASPTGIVILPALAWIGLRDRTAKRGWVVAGLFLAAFGFAVCLLYAYYRGGPPGGWIVAAREWGFHLERAPWVSLQRLFTSSLPPVDVMNGAVALLALVTVPFVWWRLNGGYAIYMLSMLWLPLSSGGYTVLGRTCALLFPLFVLAASVRSRIIVILLAVTSAMFYAIAMLLQA